MNFLEEPSLLVTLFEDFLNTPEKFTKRITIKNTSVRPILQSEPCKSTKAYLTVQNRLDMRREGLSTGSIDTLDYLMEQSHTNKIITAQQIADLMGCTVRTAQKFFRELTSHKYLLDYKLTQRRHVSHVRYLGRDNVMNQLFNQALGDIQEASGMGLIEFITWAKENPVLLQQQLREHISV